MAGAVVSAAFWALVSVAGMMAWLIGPALFACLLVDRVDAVRRDRMAVQASRAARLARRGRM